MKRRVISAVSGFLFLLALLIPALPVAQAAQMDRMNYSMTVDGNPTVTVKVLQSSYPGNNLISLRDVAAALSGTAKTFNVYIEPDPEFTQRILIYTGQIYSPVGQELLPHTATAVTDNFYASTGYNKLYLNDEERKIPTYLYSSGEGNPTDIYIRLTDLGMYLNLAVTYQADGSLHIDTASDYFYDLDQQILDGYFDDLHGVVLGDASTGRLLLSHKGQEKTQIASTTKLMTYLLVKEALDAGTITEDTLIPVSEGVYRVANSEDGTYRRNAKAGSLELEEQVSVRDLLNAMMVVSANEAAYAFCELLGGSEEGFAQMMNQRAQELGLTSAFFYNAHGLPNYSRSQTPSKRQNEMTAEDMFRLTQYLLQNHREHLIAITQQQKVELPTFGPTKNGVTSYAKTTNAILYNLPGCLGLKTGTTNRSGANLVSAMPITDVNGQTHDLIVVLFGAEDDMERQEKTAWLFRYAAQHFSTNPFPEAVPETEPTQAPTLPPETVPATTAVTLPVAPPPEPPAPAGLSQSQMLVLVGVSALAGVILTLIIVLICLQVSRKRRDYNPRFNRK